MAVITTASATADRWDDLQAALTGGGDGRSCQCAWPMLSNKDWQGTSVDDREELLRTEVQQPTPPGIVGYVDGAAAGWVRVGPRPLQQRVVRTVIVKNGTAEPLNDPSVWVISCFSIRREFRGQGLTKTLLDAAIAFAREQGARVIEAHPINTAIKKTSNNPLFVGTLATFERAGFTVVAEPKPGRAIVSLAL